MGPTLTLLKTRSPGCFQKVRVTWLVLNETLAITPAEVRTGGVPNLEMLLE